MHTLKRDQIFLQEIDEYLMVSHEEGAETGKSSGRTGVKVVEKPKVSCLKAAEQHGEKDAGYKWAATVGMLTGIRLKVESHVLSKF